jgi:hypothetical protein
MLEAGGPAGPTENDAHESDRLIVGRREARRGWACHEPDTLSCKYIFVNKYFKNKLQLTN